MKPPCPQIILVLVMAGSLGASAQSGNAVPGPTDYSAFSRFVADRNIFDPNRQPHVSGRRPVTRPRTHAIAAPAFSLVGVMGYEKGLFAFFNGNSAELKKVLPVDQSIAGFTVTDIAYGRVTLEATNQTEKLELKVGDVMREENGKWQMAGTGDITADSGSAPEESSATDGPASSPNPSASAPNDILKRLMEKREKENQ